MKHVRNVSLVHTNTDTDYFYVNKIKIYVVVANLPTIYVNRGSPWTGNIQCRVLWQFL